MAGVGSRFENGRPARACEFDPRSLRQALTVLLEWRPPVEREITGSVPYGARMRCAVKAALAPMR